MTAEESKDYMAKTEVNQLFEGMLTGLLYHKPEDHLAFLEECISVAKNEKKNIKWNTFLDLDKKPLPPIPQGDKPMRSEGQGDMHTFTTEPGAEIKNRQPLPPIGVQNQSIDVDDEKDLTEKNIITPEESEEEEVEVEFSDQRIVYVLGGPGAGKGTICARIANKYNFRHLSAGDLLRAEVAKDNERGHVIQEIMAEGKLVPQEITIALLRDSMREHKDASGFLIDGFPREISQGEQFEREVVNSDFVLSLECSKEVMEERLLKRGETSGRADDNIETIKKRFAVFLEKTVPVVEHFEKLDKAHRIDANRNIDEICYDVCQIFNGLPPKVRKTVRRRKKKTKQAVDDEEEEEWVEFSGQRIVFVLGGPGSGKGTQCTRIVEKFGYTHLSTGDLLRHEVEKGSERGQQLEQIMKEGQLVPQSIVIELLRDAMLNHPESPGFLIDGFPREISQAEEFEDEVVESHLTLFFECSEEVMGERLLKRGETSGRPDDNAETIKKRFHTFLDKTMPVIEHFAKQDKLKKIDANRTVDEVFQDVCAIFGVLPKLERKTRKVRKGSESTDEFAELAEDLGRVIEGKAFRRRHKKKKKPEEAPKSPVYEETVVAEEFIPLNDDEIAKTGKGLLNARVIFVIGGPGSGKGTQCSRVVEKFGYTHLSTGDLLRHEVESESQRGKNIAELMERGELVPNGVILELLRQTMVKQPNTKGFLVDGFPRELEQGLEFEKELAPCEFLLYFECSPETMKARLTKRGETSGRADDNEETINSRLHVFETQTLPVIQHYGDESKVRKVSAEGNVDEVYDEVMKIFESLPNRKTTASIHDFDVVFVVGGPGTGKSELCRFLADKSGRTHIALGQLLRDEAAKDSDRAKEVANNISMGTLVSPEHVLAILTEKLTCEDKNFTGYVIGGYPRTDEQVKNFTDRVSDYSHVIVLESTEEEMARRAKESLKDGDEQLLQTKIEVYQENTQKLVDSWDDDRLIKVSAAQTLEEIFEQTKSYVMKTE